MLRMIRTFIISFLCIILSVSLFSEEQEGNLLARRVIEFWKEGDYSLAKDQAKNFLLHHPDGSQADQVKVIYGHLLLKDKFYYKALEIYQTILSEEKQESVFFNKLYCLYATRQYQTLEKETSPLFSQHTLRELLAINPLSLFYRAEALFRVALQNQSEDPHLLAKTCLQVIPLYEALLYGEHHTNAQLSLAEVYHILGKGEKAADLCLELITTYPERGEELTLKAAETLSKEQPERALAMLLEISKGNGKWASKAGLKWISLQYSQKKYREIITIYPLISENLQDTAKEYVYFLLGGAHYHLQQYKKAKEYLEVFLDHPLLPTPQQKALLFMLSGCAFYMKDQSLIENVTSLYLLEYPQGEDAAKILFVRALLRTHFQNIEGAEKDLSYIIENYPAYNERSKAMFLWGETLFKLKKWQQSHETFLQYKREYPNSTKWELATHYQIFSSKSLTRNGKSPKGQQLLIRDLSELFDKEMDRLSLSKRSKYLLLWASTLFSQKKYEQTLELLRSHLKTTVQRDSLDDIHLLMALCYQKIPEMEKAFAFHAEQALKLNPELTGAEKIRINLFNTYLRLNHKAKEPSQKTGYTDQAAHHLYHVLVFGKEPVEHKKNLWLSHYYYKKLTQQIDPLWEESISKEATKALAQKIINIHKELCDYTGEKDFILLDEDRIYLEKETYQLAMLMDLLGNYRSAISILKGLERQYEEHPHYSWGWKDVTYFLLGKIYDSQSKQSEAQNYYLQVTPTNKYMGRTLFHYAKLKLARLNFQQLIRHTADTVNTNALNNILEVLKDLQTRKHLPDEPIHLEAALEYVEVKSFFENKQNKAEKQLTLLQEVKKEFTFKGDIHSKDYHARREYFPNKDAIYQTYIMYVDAKIALLKAKIAFNKGRVHEAESYREVSQMIFQTLLEDKFALSPYIVKNAKKELKQLTTSKL